MRLITLTPELICSNYEEHMCEDFPPVELKPLKNILLALEKGIYQCFGLVDESDYTESQAPRLYGYAYLIKVGEEYLIDYLAIYPEYRDQGLGSELLKLIGTELSNATSILVEVEDPSSSSSPEELETRERRLSFYLRNGLISTGVNALCFSVPYRLLEFKSVPRLHSQSEIRKLYKLVYKTMLPPKMYEENIKV
ncbi:MAG: GNAT family N-acetyltransferase [Clostridia bacterium]|nr:GNAT family N-acetyltransferase [Clostridia bacterium]